MRSALEFLAAHMTAALVALGIAGVLVVAFLSFVLARARKRGKEKPAPLEAALEAAPPVVAMTRRRRSSSRSAVR